jgi:enoyl-CoA hydratase/carnithine racemase
MGLIDVEIKQNVAIMTWNSGENRFNSTFLEAFFEAMDKVEKQSEASVLVVKSGHEKIWSNGLDLDWLGPLVMNKEIEITKAFFYRLNDFFKRIVMSPLITVAAINGHAFAGGAITACAFDFRFMRTDRGFFCFPEVDLGIPFLPGMLSLLKKSIPNRPYVTLALTGARMTAQQCVDEGIMTAAYHNDELMDKILEWAAPLTKRRIIVSAIKAELYKDIVRIIDTEDPPIIESGRLNV